MRPTAEHLLFQTKRKALIEKEISALQELSAHQYPVRVQKEIDRACERFRRKGNGLETLTQAEIDATREEQTEEELDNELAELKAEMLEEGC